MFVQSPVNDYAYQIGEDADPETRLITSQIETWGPDEDTAMQAGLIYFFIILTANGVDHPHGEYLKSRGYGTSD